MRAPSTNAPAENMPPKKVRRVTSSIRFRFISSPPLLFWPRPVYSKPVCWRSCGCGLVGRSFDGLADALIGPAATDVAFHRRVDVGVGRPGLLFEQRGGLHDLPALAVAALRYVGLPPCLLNGVISLRAQTFDGHDCLPGRALHRRLATARGGAVQINRAGAARPLAAAVLRTRQPQYVAEVPQQWHIRLAVEFTADAIHFQFDHSFSPGV